MTGYDFRFTMSASIAAATAAIAMAACGGKSQSDPPPGPDGSSVSGSPDASASPIADASPATGHSPVADPSPDASSTSSESGAESGVATYPGFIVDASGDWALPNSGGPTWRQSPTTYCNPDPDWPPRIWSDERGVFAQTRMLMFNGGHGWTPWDPQPKAALLSAGIPQGSLIFLSGACGGVSFFDGNAEQCFSTVPGISSVFVADAQHIYAVVDNRVLLWTGLYFIQYGQPLPHYSGNNNFYQLWGTSDGVAVAADGSYAYIIDGPDAAPQPLLMPAGFDAWSVWGFNRADLWFGGADGKLAHWDGEWSVIQGTLPGRCSTIAHLWGADQNLFFASSTFVGRRSNGGMATVLNAPCSQDDGRTAGTFDEVYVYQLWGTSPTEVFMVVQEYRSIVTFSGAYRNATTVARDACGVSHLYWFDGDHLAPL